MLSCIVAKQKFGLSTIVTKVCPNFFIETKKNENYCNFVNMNVMALSKPLSLDLQNLLKKLGLPQSNIY
jgi:hypothetical protein